jgi:hypothetical protein
MKKIRLITIMLIILSSFLLGCVEKPVGTPTPIVTPTATPTATHTVAPTPSPTPTPAPTPVRVPTVYRSFVDDWEFYKVLALNSTMPAPYDNNNKTLTIHVGDEVQWISYSENYTITIVSEQGLWDNTSAKLRWTYQSFDYTFNQTGIYGVYVMEFPKIRHQKIIVNP